MFPSVSFAASIEQEKMQEGIRQEQEEHKQQIRQQVEEFNKSVDEANRQTGKRNKVIIKNIPEGYVVDRKTGKLYPIKEKE
jgi:hypothetical protein